MTVVIGPNNELQVIGRTDGRATARDPRVKAGPGIATRAVELKGSGGPFASSDPNRPDAWVIGIIKWRIRRRRSAAARMLSCAQVKIIGQITSIL